MSYLPLSCLLSVGRASDRAVAFSGATQYDFARFSADVAAVATRLGVGDGRRAALLCQDSYLFSVGLFALFHAGIVVVLPPNGQPGTLAALRNAFDILIDDVFVAACAGGSFVFAPLDPVMPRLEVFTSGSSGAPKRIEKSILLLEQEAMVLDRLFGAEMGDGPRLATVSHQHVYGLAFKLLWPIATGRAFASDQHELWETLLRGLPADAVIISSPAHLERLTGMIELTPQKRVRGIFSAGAPLSWTAAGEALRVFGVLPTEIFGSTETGAIATRRQRDADVAWQALPGMVITRDEGALRLRSPFVAGDGWIETGDLIEMEGEGFHLRGRSDQIVKIEAKRISLLAVDQALAALPWVEDAVSVVLAGDGPLRLGVVVVPNAAGREQLSALGAFRFSRLLRRALNGTQESAGIPRQWRFCEQLPTAPMGKRRRQDLLALFGEAV